MHNNFLANQSTEHDPRYLISYTISSRRLVYGSTSFGDDVWDLEKQCNVEYSRQAYRIDWNHIVLNYGSLKNHGMLVSLKEFAFFRIAEPVPNHYPVTGVTAKRNVEHLCFFMKWLNDNGIYSFSYTSLSDINQYLNHLRILTVNEEITKTRAVQTFNAIKEYQKYKIYVSDPLLTPLLKNRQKKLGLSKKSSSDEVMGECKTPVIPDEVASPLIRNSLKILNEYSRRILAAFDSILDIKNGESSVESARTEPSNLKRLRKSISSSLMQNFGFNSITEYNRYETALQNSCIVIVMYLSGIRVSELLSLKSGCAYRGKSSDGIVDQYFLRGKLLKGHMKDEKWVIIEPAYKAIVTLEHLTSYYRNIFGIDNIFYSSMLVRQSNAGGTTIFSSCKDDKTFRKSLKAQSISNRFNNLISFYNSDDNFEDIPKVEGKDWKLNSRQFRRTLAKHIAREPFGIIAGALQYKHAQTAIFEGYAGSDPSWLTLLKNEETLASIDFLEELYHDIEEGSVGGIKGKELTEEFSFKGKAGDRRKDEIKYFINSHRGDFHVGPLNYCFFDPEKSKCLNSPSSKTPVFSKCRPDQCANSCISTRHLSTWEHQSEEIKQILDDKLLSEPQRVSLENQYSSIDKIIASVKGN